jgi:hypothetical protein
VVRIHFADRSCAALLNWTLEDCHANKGQLTKINQGSPQAAAPSPPPLRGWLASALLPPMKVIIVW